MRKYIVLVVSVLQAFHVGEVQACFNRRHKSVPASLLCLICKGQINNNLVEVYKGKLMHQSCYLCWYQEDDSKTPQDREQYRIIYDDMVQAKDREGMIIAFVLFVTMSGLVVLKIIDKYIYGR